MPNIVSTQGLTIYNITEVGSANTTGAASTFVINPLEGYYIAASQFSLAVSLEDEYPEVASVIFSDTTSPYTIDNTVLVTVLWNGVSSLTSDFNLPINISFDDTGDVYDSNTTALTFSIAKNNLPELYDYQKVTFAPILDQISNFNIQSIEEGGYGPDFLINPNHLQFSCFVTQDGQTPILDMTIEANIEGQVFLGDNDNQTEPLTLTQVQFPSTSTGTFEFELINTQLDLFNNVYLKTYRLYYTRDDSNIDTGAEFLYTSLFPQQYKVKSSVSPILQASGTGHGDALDGAGTSTNEIFKKFGLLNISSDQIYFEYGDTWANDGEEVTYFTGVDSDGTENYDYHFDIEANVGSSREMEVVVKDTLYNFQRHTFTIQQNEEPFIELKLIGSDDQEFNIYGNILQDAVLLDSGKVISNPSLDENAFQEIPGGGNASYYFGADTGVPFISQPVYALVVLTDSSVSAIDLQDALIVQQDGYPLDAFPQADWVSFADINNFNTIGSGIYVAYFSIRNQDKFNYLGLPVTTQDRTATISIAHPFDPTQTDTLTITQDARYNSSVDTATIKVDKYITLDGLFGSGEPSYSQASSDNITDDAPTSLFDLQNVDVENYRLYIKMDDWENDFNLPNVITTNPNQTDTYKQYPRPKLVVDYPNSSISVIDGQFVSATGSSTGLVIDTDDLVFNENYDPSDANNDYQYHVDYTLAQNTQYSTRQYIFYVFHSQYEGVYDTNNADDFFIHTQPPLQAVSVEPAIAGAENIEAYEGTTDYVIKHNGNTPTIGFWTPALGPSSFEEIVFGQQYDDWFTIDSLGSSTNPAPGFTNQNFSVTHAENTPAGDRSITIALYHSSSTPGVDGPDAQYTFTQLALSLIPEVHTVNTFQGTGTSLDYSEVAQEIKVYFRVMDYTADDFADDTNRPVVEIARWTGPTVLDGVYFDDDGVYNTEGLIEAAFDYSQVVQPSPTYAIVDPVIGFQHTHSATFTVQPNELDALYYICVRARHQYENQYNPYQYRIYTVANNAALTINSAWFDNEPETNFTISEENEISIPYNAAQLTFSVKHNVFPGFEAEDPLWPGSIQGYSYTTARFLSSNNLNVFDEYGSDSYDSITQNGVPLTFADAGNSPYIFHDGISETTSNLENNLSLATPSVTGVGFNITLNLNENNTGSDFTSYIGVWKGRRSPRTNLIDLSSFTDQADLPIGNGADPTFASDSSYHMTSLIGNPDNLSGNILNAFLTNTMLNQGVIQPIESDTGSGVFDGLKWNQSANYTATYAEGFQYTVLKFAIHKPTVSGNEITISTGITQDAGFGYGGNKVLGVEFEIEDFESVNLLGEVNGIFQNNWNTITGISQETIDNTASSLTFNSDGIYRGRIKMYDSLEGYHIRFVARANSKFTIKNLRVWEIEDDISIRPPTGNDDYDQAPNFVNPPDDILKIVQAPAPVLLAFDYSAGSSIISGIQPAAPVSLNFLDTSFLGDIDNTYQVSAGQVAFYKDSIIATLHVVPVGTFPVLALQVRYVSTPESGDGETIYLDVVYVDFDGEAYANISDFGTGYTAVFNSVARNIIPDTGAYDVDAFSFIIKQNYFVDKVKEIEFRLYESFNPNTMVEGNTTFAAGSVDTYKFVQGITSYDELPNNPLGQILPI